MNTMNNNRRRTASLVCLCLALLTVPTVHGYAAPFNAAPVTLKQQQQQQQQQKQQQQQTQQTKKQPKEAESPTTKETNKSSNSITKQQRTHKNKYAGTVSSSKPVLGQQADTKRQSPIQAKEEATSTTSTGIPLTQLYPGDTISGTVMKVLPFGALVQTAYHIPGNSHGCALLHNSRMATGDHAAPTLKVGQQIQDARVISVNRSKLEGKVVISMNRGKANRVAMTAVQQPGTQVEGRVVRLKPYGAFVDVGTKRDALLHISRMTSISPKTNHGVTSINVHDHVKVGQVIQARVIARGNNNNDNNIAISLLSPEGDKIVDQREQASAARQQRKQSPLVRPKATTKRTKQQDEDWVESLLQEINSQLQEDLKF